MAMAGRDHSFFRASEKKQEGTRVAAGGIVKLVVDLAARRLGQLL